MILLSSHIDDLLSPIKGPAIALLFLSAALKAFTKTQSLAAIRRFSLPKSISLIMQHNTSSEAGTGEMGQQKSLEVMEQVTLAGVETCKGDLFSHGGNADGLKDICMSFSFFKLLCLRYSGNTSSREAHRKTWPFIRELLLSGERRHERVFRVLEEELAFLYDLLYTKHAVIFQPKRLYLRLVEFLLIGIASLLIFQLRCPVIIFHSISSCLSLDFFATRVAFAIYLVAETAQVILLAFTRWAKVKCVCRYVKHRRSLKNSNLTEKCIEFICRLPSQKPWEKKLHQYSLLESFTYRPCKLLANPFMYQFTDWRRDGQKEGASVALSREVQKAVVDHLENSESSQLENGEGSMRRHNVSSLLSYACKFTTQTQVIMVWHIATTICENKAGSHDSEEGVTSFNVATSLSKYLAYLVAFEPRLLPDHPAITESLFTETIEKARRQLRGCDTVREMIDKLYQTANRNGVTALCRGTKLAEQLLEEISDRSHMWQILADFWVEMMLFVAPSDDVRAHADKLANGGELLTHVWALLYHAGIERRSFVEP